MGNDLKVDAVVMDSPSREESESSPRQGESLMLCRKPEIPGDSWGTFSPFFQMTIQLHVKWCRQCFSNAHFIVQDSSFVLPFSTHSLLLFHPHPHPHPHPLPPLNLTAPHLTTLFSWTIVQALSLSLFSRVAILSYEWEVKRWIHVDAT